MTKASVEEVKEVKTLQVRVAYSDSGPNDKSVSKNANVTFRFPEGEASSAEVSVDGGEWQRVAVLQKAIGAFLDRYPPEFSE